MNEDAILYLTTVNFEGPRHNKLGTKWHMRGLGHFNYPTLRILKNMLRDAGLTFEGVSFNPNVVKLIARK